MPPFAFYVYLIGLGSVMLGLALAFHAMVVMDELRNDHRHPISACDLLNRAILPEYVSVAASASFFLLTGHFMAMMLLFPLCAYHLYRYASRPLMSRPGIYDPTSILTIKELSYAEKEAYGKTFYYAVATLYFSYKTFRLALLGR